MSVPRLGSIALDCHEPWPSAAFSAALVGGKIAFASDDFVAVATGRGWISTVRVEDYVAPTWPAGSVPKQMQPDLAGDGLAGVDLAGDG